MDPAGKGISMGAHPADSTRASTAPPSPSSSSAASSAAGGSGAAPGGGTGGERSPSPAASPGRQRKRVSASPTRVAAAPESAPSRKAAAVAAVPAVRGHKTVKLRPRVYDVPTLGYLCVQLLAGHSDSIVDLRGVGQDTARQLLREIMDRQKLTYPLAKVFMDCGDDELSSAIGALNLWDAIPAGRQGRHSRHL